MCLYYYMIHSSLVFAKTIFPVVLRVFFLSVFQGIARRLVITALEKAARVRQVAYDEIKKLDQGVRRHVHDDITIVVIFIDHETLDDGTNAPELSVRGFVDAVGPSDFNFA